jgi:hypothetical protein
MRREKKYPTDIAKEKETETRAEEEGRTEELG